MSNGNIYQDNETYAGNPIAMDIPQSQGISITTGLGKVNYISSMIAKAGNAVAKVGLSLYKKAKDKESETDFREFTADLSTSTTDFNTTKDTDKKVSPLADLSNPEELTDEERKQLEDPKTFLHEKYFNKLKAFKEKVYNKYPKVIADELYDKAEKTTYSYFTKEYDHYKNVVYNKEKTEESLITTTNILKATDKYFMSIEDPKEKEQAVDLMINQAQEAIQQGKPLEIDGKQYHIDNNTLAVLQKVWVNRLKSARVDEKVKTKYEVANKIDSDINGIIAKYQGTPGVLYQKLVEYKANINKNFEGTGLDDNTKLIILDKVNAVTDKYKIEYNRKLQQDKGKAFGNNLLNLGHIDPEIADNISNDIIASTSFFQTYQGNLANSLSQLDPKDIKEKSINLISELTSKFGNNPNTPAYVEYTRKTAEELIAKKNNTLLSSIKLLSNSGSIDDYDKAINIADKLYYPDNPEKKNTIIKGLVQARQTRVLIDGAIKQDPSQPYTQEAISLLNKTDANGKIPPYVANARRAIAKKTLNGLFEAYATGDKHKINLILNNNTFLLKDLKKEVDNLPIDKKLQMGVAIYHMQKEDPNTATNLTNLMSYAKATEYNTINNLATMMQGSNNTLNYANAFDKYETTFKANNKDYVEYKTKMRDKYGAMLDETEIKAMYMAGKFGDDNADDYYDNVITKIGVLNPFVSNIYVRNDSGDPSALHSQVVTKTAEKMSKLAPNAVGTRLIRNKDGDYIMIPIGMNGEPLQDDAGNIMWMKVKVGEEE